MSDTVLSRTEAIRDLDARHVLQTYRRAPVAFERGEGVQLFDVEGRAYLDFVSGVGVMALGYGHPRLVQAIADQGATLLHCSNLFHHPLQGEVAARLAQLSGLDRTFFCNSGTEAVEACLKFARRHWHTRGQARTRIVALEHAFHGRTMGSLSLTWDPHYREPFAPLLADITFVPANDPDALRAAVTADTAAVVIEAIQGEGGVRPLTPAFAGAVNDACVRSGALLIADEVQCGLGRTGSPFYSQALGLKPDLMALGKALGAGIPVGAAVLSERVASTVSPGDHGSTYGGNLLACRAALVFLNELIGGNLLRHVAGMGLSIEKALRALAARHACVSEVRGAGVMWGIDLKIDAAPAIDAARSRGLLINRTGGTVIRLLPPYVVTEADLERAIPILDDVLTEMDA
jgi:predicted acetylornithine/succinylornithine family transaminase